MDEAVLKADSAADKIGTAYLEALKDIQKRLDSIFRNFSVGISEAEAKRILKNVREPDVIKRLEKAVDRIEDAEKKALMLAEINAPAYRARIDQLNILSGNVKTVCEKIGGKTLSLMDRELYGITESTYYRSIFDTQKGTGLGFTFALLSQDRINEILLTNWSGKHYSERIWENTEMLAETVQEILLKGFLTGKSSGRMANELQERMHSSYSRSLTLIRTEASFAANSAELESFRETGAEKYRFVATLDLRTSEICRSLDGNEYPLTEACQGENCPPMHPRCRSTTIPALDDEIMTELKRRATDPITGKPATVSADMSYKEWYDKHVKGNAAAEANEKAVRNISSDRNQFERYRKLLGREMPKTLEEFQKIKYTDTHNFGLLKAQAKGMGYYTKALINEPDISTVAKTIADEAGADEDDIINARCRYRGTSQEYTRFSKAMDLPQQRERVTADGLGNIGVGEIKVDLTEKDYSDIIEMKGKMSDRDVRKWYDYHDKRIGEHIDIEQTLENQAKQSHSLRNEYKYQAMELMKDQVKRKWLDENKPLHDFDFYYRKYSKLYDNPEDIYKAIIDSSMRPNKEVNKQFGLE